MSYHADPADIYRLAATYVDKIPQESQACRPAGGRPTKFELHDSLPSPSCSANLDRLSELSTIRVH